MNISEIKVHRNQNEDVGTEKKTFHQKQNQMNEENDDV